MHALREELFMRSHTIVIFIAIVVSAILIAGCTQTPAGPQTTVPTTVQTTAVPTTPMPPADTVRVASTPLGNVLVDGQGLTLYYFSKDIPGSGTSNCSGQCEVIWPVFFAQNVIVSPPLSASDFSTITRSEGTRQTAYKGWPLYFYQNDTSPGETSGEGIGRIWFVAKPDSSVMIAEQGSLGLFLTDDTGHTLYYFANDKPGMSACTGGCVALWPPFSSDPLVLPSILKSTDFTTFTRTDGGKQLAFMGRPLYYFSNDRSPGMVAGEGYNNLWYAANITGSLPAPTATPTPTPTPTVDTSDSGGGGSGY
jgi:predicted lipoprotein with Yx(FWY)xxD motif